MLEYANCNTVGNPRHDCILLSVHKLLIEHPTSGGPSSGHGPRRAHVGGSTAPDLRRGQPGLLGPVLLAGVVRLTRPRH